MYDWICEEKSSENFHNGVGGRETSLLWDFVLSCRRFSQAVGLFSTRVT